MRKYYAIEEYELRKYCALMFGKKRNYCYDIIDDIMNELRKIEAN